MHPSFSRPFASDRLIFPATGKQRRVEPGSGCSGRFPATPGGTTPAQSHQLFTVSHAGPSHVEPPTETGHSQGTQSGHRLRRQANPNEGAGQSTNPKRGGKWKKCTGDGLKFQGKYSPPTVQAAGWPGWGLINGLGLPPAAGGILPSEAHQFSKAGFNFLPGRFPAGGCGGAGFRRPGVGV